MIESPISLSHFYFPVQVPSDLDMLLRATYFGSIVLLVSVGQRLG